MVRSIGMYLDLVILEVGYLWTLLHVSGSEDWLVRGFVWSDLGLPRAVAHSMREGPAIEMEDGRVENPVMMRSVLSPPSYFRHGPLTLYR